MKESLDLLKLCSDVESRASAVGDAAVGGGEVVTAAMVSIYRGGDAVAGRTVKSRRSRDYQPGRWALLSPVPMEGWRKQKPWSDRLRQAKEARRGVKQACDSQVVVDIVECWRLMRLGGNPPCPLKARATDKQRVRIPTSSAKALGEGRVRAKMMLRIKVIRPKQGMGGGEQSLVDEKIPWASGKRSGLAVRCG